MGSMSIWHWLFVILVIAVLCIPISKILNRLGFSRWWTIVYFIPFVNIVGIWILAYARWPAVNREQQSSKIVSSGATHQNKALTQRSEQTSRRTFIPVLPRINADSTTDSADHARAEGW